MLETCNESVAQTDGSLSLADIPTIIDNPIAVIMDMERRLPSVTPSATMRNVFRLYNKKAV